MNTPAKIKICGISRVEDAKIAIQFGAWAVGFIFYHKSPRAVTSLRVAEILSQLKHDPILKVGVFVDDPIDEITHIVRTTGLNAVQLHGMESPDFCLQLRSTIPSCKLIKAFRLRSDEELTQVAKYSMCDARLVDAYVEGQPGGTGRVARWDLATLAKAHGELILSGGLNSDNVSQALGQVRPDAFDVSSGVEESPGIKDHAKMRAFFQTVRTYEQFS